MVESTSARAAEMALHLCAVHRWSVSGTPIGKFLDDLYGLVLFLGLSPFDERFWWQRALQYPFSCGNTAPLVSFLRPLLWRSSKKAVADQLGIPQQREQLSKLIF